MGKDRRLCTDRRSAGDRRFGTNPKGYNGPERRAIFDRRNHTARRQKKYITA